MKDLSLFGPAHASTPTHEKTRRLAKELGIPVLHALGVLHALWAFALVGAQDGNLGVIDSRELSNCIRFTGRGVDKLVRALETSGWVHIVDDEVVLHEWDQYAGLFLEKRRSDAERKRRVRGQSKEQHAMRPQTVHGHSTERRGESRGEESRVEKNKYSSAPAAPDAQKSKAPKPTLDELLAAPWKGSPSALEHLRRNYVPPLDGQRGRPSLDLVLDNVRDWWSRKPPRDRWTTPAGIELWVAKEAGRAQASWDREARQSGAVNFEAIIGGMSAAMGGTDGR